MPEYQDDTIRILLLAAVIGVFVFVLTRKKP